VTGSEILHDQPGMLIAHAEIEQTHDARTADTLHDLVFLQEAPERVIQVAVLGLTVAGDFQRHQLARRLAFAQVEIRHHTSGYAADVAIAANERAPETLRLPAIRTRTPNGARESLPLLRG